MQRKIIVRLLSGMLRGCEFQLTTGRTLFLVMDESNICQQGDLPPDNIIYIPGEKSSQNFEIIVPSGAGEEVKLREVYDNEAREVAILPDERIFIDKLSLAWRDSDSVFSDEIIFNDRDRESEVSEPVDEKPQKKPLLKMLLAGCVLVSALSIAYYWFNDSQRKISDIETFLQHDRQNYQVILGKDRFVYIFASDHQMAEWARQTLSRYSYIRQARVVTRISEQERISQWLHKEWPQLRFHRVKIVDPRQPVIELSAERSRLSQEEKKRLIAALKNILPCADGVVLTSVSDRQVRALAAEGLKKIAAVYTERTNADSVTFTLQGTIDDAELARIKEFINYYQQVWGGDYIRFALDMKDDRLKGRSYKYGAEGYIKSSPRHWYFPGKINTE